MEIINLQTLKEHAKKSFPNEAVGVVKDRLYIPLVNTAEDPKNNFQLSTRDYIKYAGCPVVHSHCGTKEKLHQLRSPSITDQRQQMAMAVEWGLVATDGVDVTDLAAWGNLETRPSLLEREFIEGINDCFALVQDWHFQVHGIRIANIPRTPGWHERNENLIISSLESAGAINRVGPLEVGDVLLMKIQSPVVNHLGIYTGGNNVLHHCIGKLSGYASYTALQKYIVGTVRHRDLK